MRKLLTYMLIIAASVTLMSGGCSGDDEPEPNPGPTPVNPDPGNPTSLSVSPTVLNFDEHGVSQTVTISSPTAGWTAKSDQDWCYTTRKSTTELEVSVSYNYTTSERNATITVTAGEQTATIHVTQPGSQAELTVNRNSMHFAVDGGQDSIVYIHCSPTYENLQYEVKGGDGWLTVTPESGQASSYIYLSATYNHAFSPRSATVTITLPETEPQVISVTQPAGFVRIETKPEVYTFPYFYDQSFVNTFRVTTTAEDPENITIRFSDDTWLHIKYDSYHRWDDSMVSYQMWDEQSQRNIPVSFREFWIYADENAKYQERYASADFYYGDSIIGHAEFMQRPTPRLSVVASHGTALPTSGGSVDVRVYSNYEWKYSEPTYHEEGEPWLSVERINDSVLRISCQPNTTGKHRPNGLIVVESYGYSQNIVIKEMDGTAGEGYGYGDGTEWDK